MEKLKINNNLTLCESENRLKLTIESTGEIFRATKPEGVNMNAVSDLAKIEWNNKKGDTAKFRDILKLSMRPTYRKVLDDLYDISKQMGISRYQMKKDICLAPTILEGLCHEKFDNLTLLSVTMIADYLGYELKVVKKDTTDE